MSTIHGTTEVGSATAKRQGARLCCIRFQVWHDVSLDILDIGRRPLYAQATRRGEIAMLYALLALMSPLWDRAAAQSRATDTSLSRLLLFVAAALCAVLAILLVDLHRDELHALGLVGGVEPINAVFMSP